MSVRTDLCNIMEKHGSDKSVRNHNYTLVYSKLFESIRHNILRIFELGLGTNNTDILSNMGRDGRPGASLYGWAEYFNNSKIFGADIDKRILFNTDRISTFYCDQTSAQIINELWSNINLNENFDIIIEDGLHKFDANVCFFENSIHKLKKGGYYIIEDIETNDIPLFNDIIKKWQIKYTDLSFKLEQLYHPINNVSNYGLTSNNNLLVIKRGF